MNSKYRIIVERINDGAVTQRYEETLEDEDDKDPNNTLGCLLALAANAMCNADELDVYFVTHEFLWRARHESQFLYAVDEAFRSHAYIDKSLDESVRVIMLRSEIGKDNVPIWIVPVDELPNRPYDDIA